MADFNRNSRGPVLRNFECIDCAERTKIDYKILYINILSSRLCLTSCYQFVNLLFLRFKMGSLNPMRKKNIFAAPFSQLNPIVW